MAIILEDVGLIQSCILIQFRSWYTRDSSHHFHTHIRMYARRRWGGGAEGMGRYFFSLNHRQVTLPALCISCITSWYVLIAGLPTQKPLQLNLLADGCRDVASWLARDLAGAWTSGLFGTRLLPCNLLINLYIYTYITATASDSDLCPAAIGMDTKREWKNFVTPSCGGLDSCVNSFWILKRNFKIFIQT